MIKKVSFAFVIAVFLILSIHKSVAASFSELRELNFENLELPTITCENLSGVVLNYENELVSINDEIVNYLMHASGQYGVWFQELRLHEGTEPKWDDFAFDKFKMSIKNLEKSSDQIYGMSSYDESFVEALQAKIDTCFQGGEKRDRAGERLQHFLLDDSEHLSSIADFLAQMSVRLRDLTRDWERMKDGERAAPPGYFTPLSAEADIYAEASQLARENAQYIKALFAKFRSSLTSLVLPLAPPQHSRID